MNTQNTGLFPKTILILLIVFLSLHQNSSAQEGAYWMGLSSKNPALIGTPSDWVWGIAEFADIPNYDDACNSFALIADYTISQKAGTVGANFIRTKVGDNKAFLAELLYAYTLTGKKNRQWNFGVSTGIEGQESDYYGYQYSNPKASYLKTNLGTLYRSRKLDLGLSYAFFNELNNDYSSGSLIDNYVTFITAYRFYIKEKFVIEPNLRIDFLGGGDNDGYLGIHTEYENIAWVGYENTGIGGVSSIYTGADVSNRFRIALRYSFSEYYQQHGRSKYYQFTLGYKLN
ncbi:type IX secretion system membrane protein PorP/SprF [Draconibacterium orientale]|uniref:type IX secretion system membrane protein PorP/SprF n=1 Tax=Draconibacterium orientale TaxID=1168034 RepID=UPI002ABD43E7|nr:type IX secretion system membrane protein PorP/SprF [Draconibacterium orientale]